MKSLIIGAVLLVLCIAFIQKGHTNDSSSFLSVNASLAVVVDHDYVQQKGSDILTDLQKILADTIRENLKNGGVNLKYFTWSPLGLKKDFIAAITIMDCQRTWKFFEATLINSILLFAITDSDCARLPSDKALMIPIIEKGEELPQLLLDIKVQNALKWKSCVLLLDKSIVNQNSQIIEALVHDNSNSKIDPISLYIYTFDDDLRSQRKRARMRETLRTFTRSRNNQFIVFSNSVEDIVEVAEELKMFHIHNQWLYFDLHDNNEDWTFESLTQNLKEGANIAFAINETNRNCEESLRCLMSEVSMGFILSLSKLIREEESIFSEISDEEWEAIRLTKSEKQEKLLNYTQDYLKLNSACASCSKWRFKTAISWGKTQEHYKKTHESSNKHAKNKYEFIDVGYWSPILGFVTTDAIFPHIKERFRNITMDVITYHNPPWQILKINEKGDVIQSSGIVIELLRELSRKLNFTYRLYDARLLEDDTAINENDTTFSDLYGSLTHYIPQSVVELIQNNRFFIAAVACSIDDPESKPFNYTNPISIQKYTFLSRRPDEVSRIYLFTAPFTLETWASLIGVLLTTAPLLYLINILVPNEDLRTKGLCKINSCFWYVYGALLQQGGMYLPRADSGRLIVGVWWIAVLVLVTTYCGNLVAFLTFPKFQPAIDFLFQTFHHTEVEQFGLRNGTFFEKYSSLTSREDFKRFMEKATIYNNLSTENIGAVEKGHRINIDWRINLELTIQKHFEKNKECKFVLGKEDFVEEQIGLIMPINSPYMSLVNDEIKRLHQMGFLDRWHKINLPLRDKCKGKVLGQITNHKVNLTDMQGCFLVLLIGFTIALFIILYEYWCRSLSVSKKGNIGQYAT
ncbi:ionotropic receptor 93a [Episyrphus balteatus]|uniref:ionotropic receptor 93a n=1 Tax=Episyrphus balteatus TaxID=286459 RepID=UPI0024858C0D|nr:ionotropic receptor 93a [Episyrphus balteatus]